MPDAEIIAIGSELLGSQRLDTNSLYLTDQLNALGVEVVRKTVVGDERERLVDSILGAMARSQILVLTGGLGPTEDDLTRDAVASALGRTLEFSQPICDQIEERFRRFGRKMVEINRRQAYLVSGAQALTNDRGTAPGQWIEHNSVALMLLPGPPNELKAMFERECLPRLEKVLPAQAIRTRQLRCVGIPESDLDQLISPVYKSYPTLATTILAVSGEIHVHLRARSPRAEEAEAVVEEAFQRIDALLGDRVYSRNNDSLEKVVGDMLRARNATLSVAESITGGLLGGRITAVPSASDYYLGGFLTYSNEMKTKLLGVPAEMLAAAHRRQRTCGEGHGGRRKVANRLRLRAGDNRLRWARGRQRRTGIRRPRLARRHGSSPRPTPRRSRAHPHFLHQYRARRAAAQAHRPGFVSRVVFG